MDIAVRISGRLLATLVGAALAFWAGAILWAAQLLNEPIPYRAMGVSTPNAIEAKPGQELAVFVHVFRTKTCPYTIERVVYDSAGTKLYDSELNFSEPGKLGDDSFIAPVKLLPITPAPGTGLYSVRLGMKCNIVQRVFPNRTDWLTSTFEVVDAAR